MLFSFRRVLAFLWLVCVLAVQLFGFAMMALCVGSVCKDNVLHCSVGKRQKNALAGGNTAKRLVCCGFCVLAQAFAVPVGRAAWLYFAAAVYCCRRALF